MPSPPALEELALSNAVPQSLPALEGCVFEGYRNKNGSAGMKNILGISTSVQCVAGVLDYAVKRIKSEMLSKYSNVDNIVVLNHSYGCGVTINASESIIPIRTLQYHLTLIISV